MTRYSLGLLALMAVTAQSQTYYGNGYTIVEGVDPNALPDDLEARVFKTISASTVEDGLHQLLQGSGWALAGYVSADPEIWRLYRQPYPDNKRTLNPMSLAGALSWIAGEGWDLVIDPVNRLVSYEVRSRYARRTIIPQTTIHSGAEVMPVATTSYISDGYTPPTAIQNEAESRLIAEKLSTAYQKMEQPSQSALSPTVSASKPSETVAPVVVTTSNSARQSPPKSGQDMSVVTPASHYNFANFIESTSKSNGKKPVKTGSKSVKGVQQ